MSMYAVPTSRGRSNSQTTPNLRFKMLPWHLIQVQNPPSNGLLVALGVPELGLDVGEAVGQRGVALQAPRQLLLGAALAVCSR